MEIEKVIPPPLAPPPVIVLTLSLPEFHDLLVCLDMAEDEEGEDRFRQRIGLRAKLFAYRNHHLAPTRTTR